MDSLCSILGIDRVDMNGRLTLIEEIHGSSANFLINSVLSNSLKKQHGICLALFHDTFGHYHNVGMRNGHNLFALKEKGEIAVVEFMDNLACNLDDTNEESLRMMKDFTVTGTKERNTTNRLTFKLFQLVKDKFRELSRHKDSVTIIVDDLGHLFNLGLNIRDVTYFIRYLRSLVAIEEVKSELCIVIHTYDADSQHCSPVTMTNGLKYMADLIVTTEPLKSGHSADASGKMIVRWKADSVRVEYHWPESITYLYKLMDWQAKIYAPGSAT